MPPKPALSLPSLHSLKLAQIKHLASQCGINTSGTKAVLTSRLQNEIMQPSPKAATTTTAQSHAQYPLPSPLPAPRPNTHRILSIDMGIRNLAYCVLDVHHPSSTSASTTTTPSPTPILLAWRRLAIAARPPLHQAATTPSSSTASSTVPPTIKEDFTPSAYASLAYTFLTRHLLTYQPSLILIERQRYRTMGSAAVQEWTVRVNLLEGMLHAVLRTLREERRWAGEVEGVSPARVGAFWLDGRERNLDRETDSAGAAKKVTTKMLKIDCLGGMLRGVGQVGHGEEGELVIRTGSMEVEKVVVAFLRRWDGLRRRVGLGTGQGEMREGEGAKEVGMEVEKLGKLDDLADCLLQALAWVRWQENARTLREGRML